MGCSHQREIAIDQSEDAEADHPTAKGVNARRVKMRAVQILKPGVVADDRIIC
jgi:hypothetical protein